MIGAAGGLVVGALAGSLIARANPWDHNEWNGFRRAMAGAAPGALLGGIAAGVAQSSPLTGVLLGVAGATTGALLGRYLAER